MAAPLLLTDRTADGPEEMSFPPNTIKMVRRPDANLSDPCASVVSSVRFRPTGNLASSSSSDPPVLFAAGMDKALRFFRLGQETSRDGGDGPPAASKVHGVHFPDLSGVGDRNEDRSLETVCASPGDGNIAAFVVLWDARSRGSRGSTGRVKWNGSVRPGTAECWRRVAT